MIQINTSTLLSKYYSESAKQVDEIFTKIARMCQEESHTFTCVLIDEVESIASSREYSTNGGESHDSLRATNALLTGLDKTKNYPNLIFLCTSNMIDALDNAFLDRCGLKREVTAPPLASQYEILRIRLQKLIDRRVVQTEVELPPYEDAKTCALLDSASVGARLLAIAAKINSSTGISGRSLTQLPELAVLQYLREEECDLGMALTFIERLVKPAVKEQKDEEHKAGQQATEIEIRGKKRTFKMGFDEDLDIECEFIDLGYLTFSKAENVRLCPLSRVFRGFRIFNQDRSGYANNVKYWRSASKEREKNGAKNCRISRQSKHSFLLQMA